MEIYKLTPLTSLVWFQEGPGVRNTQYTNSGVKLLNVANLIDGHIDLSTSNRYIAEEEAYGRYRHFLCDKGDLVIASSGIKVDYFDKKMGFVRQEHLPLCMNTSTIRFKVLDKNILNIRYFMYFLKSNFFKSQLSKQITGSAQLNFGPSHLKRMIVPLINIDYQNHICGILDKVYELEYKLQTELTLLNQLVKSPYLDEHKRGATIQGVPSKVIKDSMVPDVPLEMQKRYTALVKQSDKSKYREAIFLYLLEDVLHML